MKNSTKLKIINWVKKVLKYYDPVRLPLKEETRKIQEVRWEDSFDKDRPIDITQLNHIISHGIAFEIEKRGVIQVKESIEYGKKIVRARAFFIEPFERWENER